MRCYRQIVDLNRTKLKVYVSYQLYEIVICRYEFIALGTTIYQQGKTEFNYFEKYLDLCATDSYKYRRSIRQKKSQSQVSSLDNCHTF